jgi:hypothetical protein
MRALGWSGMAARLFWLLMLAIHIPLLFRSGTALIQQGGGLESLLSITTLGVSSAFFLLKVCGWKMTAGRPSWRKAVVYFLLGALLHLLLFCPSLPLDEFTVVLTMTGTLSVFLLLAAIGRSAPNAIARKSSHPGLAEILRSRNQCHSFIQWIHPCLQPIPLVAASSRRGPPIPSQS